MAQAGRLADSILDPSPDPSGVAGAPTSGAGEAPNGDRPPAEAERGPLSYELSEQQLSIFVPAHLAAACADCFGFFLAAAGRCPGCGSTSWVPIRERIR